MTKFKKLMALAAVSMLGIQLIGAGTAFAASGDECDWGSDNLEITIDTDDVTIRINDGVLECDDTDNGSFTAVDDSLPIDSVDSITVEMDDDSSDADFVVLLEDGATGDAAEWEAVDTFDVDITTTFVVEGSGITDDAADRLSIKFGASTFSFSGISGTYKAHDLDITGGADKDLIDASKATVKVTADGGAETDVIKGGTKNDDLQDSSDDDIIYGNGGNDLVVAGYQAWGGEGSDDLSGLVVAPGAGDDDVDADLLVTYADLTTGVEYTDDGTGPVTGGAAGDDDLAGDFFRLAGSQGDDVLVFIGGRLYGNGGNDVMKCDGCADDGDDTNGAEYATGGAGDDLIVEYDYTYSGGGDDDTFYGNTGNDVLRGRFGNDTLRGGPGKDQAWGGGGAEDLCTAEVLNRCELIKH